MSPTKHPSSQITLGWSEAKRGLFLPIPRKIDANFAVLILELSTKILKEATLICVRGCRSILGNNS